MNSLERRVEALEKNAGVGQDHIFVRWTLPGEVTVLECGGVFVNRNDGEGYEDFVRRAYEEFKSRLKAGIHWVNDGVMLDYGKSYLKEERTKEPDLQWSVGAPAY